MASFEKYAPILKRWEGGFVNNPNDPGGATNMGVTLATYRKFFGAGKTVADLKRMSEREWTEIMRTYWDECKADGILNQSIANIVVDFNVNAGIRGKMCVQKALGCKPDGIFGKLTLAALNADNQECVFCKIKKARCGYYEDVVRNRPSSAVFLKGWLNRVNSFEFE